MLTPFTTHPRKPRTPHEVSEFEALVRSDILTMEEIGKRYGTSERTIHRWAGEFGVGNIRRRRAGFRGPFRAGARDIARSTVRAVEEIGKLAGLGTPGVRRDVASPTDDADVAGVLDEIRRLSLETRTTADMAKLQVPILRLLCLLTAKAPHHTYWSLFGSAQELFRLILCARKVEGDLPPAHNPATLRQEAARQLMQELGSVMSHEEQQVFGRMLNVAADRIDAQRLLAMRPVPVWG